MCLKKYHCPQGVHRSDRGAQIASTKDRLNYLQLLSQDFACPCSWDPVPTPGVHRGHSEEV